MKLNITLGRFPIRLEFVFCCHVGTKVSLELSKRPRTLLILLAGMLALSIPNSNNSEGVFKQSCCRSS